MLSNFTTLLNNSNINIRVTVDIKQCCRNCSEIVHDMPISCDRS